jgi:hypothetical protein
LKTILNKSEIYVLGLGTQLSSREAYLVHARSWDQSQALLKKKKKFPVLYYKRKILKYCKIRAIGFYKNKWNCLDYNKAHYSTETNNFRGPREVL